MTNRMFLTMHGIIYVVCICTVLRSNRHLADVWFSLQITLCVRLGGVPM